MKINTELIQKVFLALFMVFIVGKVLAHFLKGLSENLFVFKKKEQTPDLDMLINRKKSELSGLIHNSDTPPPLPSSKKEMAILQRYDDSKFNKEEIKKIVELFEHRQWGEGQHFRQAQNRAIQIFELPIQVKHIAQSFQQLHQHPAILKKKSLLSYNQWIELLARHSSITFILEELKQNKFDRSIEILKLAQVKEAQVPSDLSFKKALVQWIKGAEKLDFNLAQLQMWHSSFGQALGAEDWVAIEIDKRTELNSEQWQTQLYQLAFLYDQFQPFPAVAKDDRIAALAILRLEENTSWPEIKTRYKKLAKEIHPDRFLAQNLPQELLEILNHNFNQLQTAHDILQKFYQE